MTPNEALTHAARNTEAAATIARLEDEITRRTEQNLTAEDQAYRLAALRNQ